jgi:tRNA(fMet)-specific endonuclease VapC
VPVAELVPLPPEGLDAASLLDRWRSLPPMNVAVIFLDTFADPSALPEHPDITFTLAGLSVGTLVTGDQRERAVRQAHLQLAESSFRALPFDAAAARRFGGVAASLRQAGRKPAIRAYDALIAAESARCGMIGGRREDGQQGAIVTRRFTRRLPPCPSYRDALISCFRRGARVPRRVGVVSMVGGLVVMRRAVADRVAA